MNMMDKKVDKKGPMQYIYYMTELEDSPCQLCFVRPLCSKSFTEGSACELFMKFIEKKEKDILETVCVKF